MFAFKRFIMKKIVDKKKKNQPFDYQKAETYSFGSDGDGTFNNSYYFSAHSSAKNQSLYVRLGLRDNGKAEVWVYFDNEQDYFLHDKLIYSREDAPLKVVNNNGAWSFNFNGELKDKDNKVVACNLNCDFISSNQAVDFFYHMPSIRFGTAMGQDKWNKEYFKGVQENNSVHYEQEGKLIGKIALGDKELEIDLPCVRDHSYGKRVWGYMNNHLWLAALSDDCLFNFSMVSYPSMSILEVGHLRERENPIEYVTKISYDRNEIVKGEIPKELSLTAKINGKRDIKINAKLIRYVPYVFEDGAYTLIEGIADYEVDGITCRGILEIGFNKDQSRFMNGKPINKIKA